MVNRESWAGPMGKKMKEDVWGGILSSDEWQVKVWGKQHKSTKTNRLLKKYETAHHLCLSLLKLSSSLAAELIRRRRPRNKLPVEATVPLLLLDSCSIPNSNVGVINFFGSNSLLPVISKLSKGTVV